jgi:hypothetical protein
MDDVGKMRAVLCREYEFVALVKRRGAVVFHIPDTSGKISICLSMMNTTFGGQKMYEDFREPSMGIP